MQTPPQTVFLDAAGTLIHVCEPVGDVYARIAARHSISVDPAAVGKAFRTAWKLHPAPQNEGIPSKDDDRSWWRALVHSTLSLAKGRPLEVMDALFEELYSHYAKPEAWGVFDDVQPTLDRFKAAGCRMFVLSNFDQRLRSILSGHHIGHCFDGMIISSEVGASKPHRLIFDSALRAAGADAANCVHIGDSEEADVQGATAAGIRAFRVDRPTRGLVDIVNEML